MNHALNLYDETVLSDALDAARHIPSQILSASAGTAQNVLRDKGLILTKDQLLNLKRYEVRGLGLPVTLTDVIGYLGYETGAGSNLEARDFQESFTLIRNHAMRWDPLRNDLINVGSELSVFGGQMQVYLQGIEEIYEDLRGQAGNAIEAEARADFIQYVIEVAGLIEQRALATTALKSRLDSFSRDLSLQVLPSVQIKLQSINNSNLSVDIRRLNIDIDERARLIDQKQNEYRKLVGIAAGSSFLLLGLGIYFGVQAEKIRKEVESLKRTQHQKIADLEQKNKIHGSLQRVRSDLQDLELVVLDADIATKNLTAVWNALHIYVNESVEQAERINDTLTLRRLINGFRLVAAPWENIQRDANLLLEVFKQADDEYRAEYGHS